MNYKLFALKTFFWRIWARITGRPVITATQRKPLKCTFTRYDFEGKDELLNDIAKKNVEDWDREFMETQLNSLKK